MNPQQPIKEGEDYIVDTQGRYIFTREFHIKRGHCCHNNCQNCPYKAQEQEEHCVIQ